MSEYKITQINVDGPPNQWNGPKGTIYYIGVMLDKWDKPVSIGKKAADALKIGDTVYGEVIPQDGFMLDKWKHGEVPQSSAPSSSSGDTKAYLRDISTIPVDFMKSLLQYYDVQKLESNPTQYQSYISLVKLLSEEAIGMIENIRASSGSLGAVPTHSPTTKDQSPSVDRSAAEPLSLGDAFRSKRAVTANDDPPFGDEDYQGE